jgi:WD40 repeat protein
MSELVGTPYVGPRFFTYEDRHLYFGREQEARELLAHVISQPLTVFYAQSGAGKTSLINTRLLPGLQKNRFELLPVARVGGTLPDEISEVDNIFVFNLLTSLNISEQAPSELTSQTISTHLAQYRQVQGISAPIVLIVDQFEEVLTTNPDRWQERQAFFSQLGQAIADDGLLWVVLSMREDYIAGLDPYASLLPGKLRSRFNMRRMTAKAALEAIEKPADLGGRPYAPGVAQSLIDNLRQARVQGQEASYLGEFVEPVQLQVVCYQLWQNLQNEPLGPITQEDLERLGDVDTALAQFYEVAIHKVNEETGESERNLRRWFQEQLITEAQTRGTVFRGPRTTAGLANESVDLLASKHYMLRAEIRAGGTWYELVHDRFIEPIVQANNNWLLRHPLIQDAEDWEKSGRDSAFLYEGAQLKNTLASLDLEAADPLIRQFLEASILRQKQRRQRIINALAPILLIGILAIGALAIWALIQRDTAQDNAKQALSARSTSDANARLASTREVDALVARATSEANAHLASTREQEALVARATSEANAILAGQNAVIAKDALDLAISRQLALDAVERLAIDNPNFNPELARLLSIEAVRTLHTAETDSALRQSIRALNFRDAHDGMIRLIALRPDGQQAATVDDTGRLSLWSLPSGELLHNEFTDLADAQHMAYSSDGSRLVVAHMDDLLRIWEFACPGCDPVAGRPWSAGNGEILALAFSSDGRLATSTSDQMLRFWDPADQTRLPLAEISFEEAAISPAFAGLAIEGPPEAVAVAPSRTSAIDATQLAFRPDGRQLAIGFDNGEINLFDDNAVGPVFLAQQNGPIELLDYNPAGDLLVAASPFGDINLYDLADEDTGSIPIAGNGEAMVALFFTGRGNELAAISESSKILLWDLDVSVQDADVFCPVHDAAIDAASFSTETSSFVATFKDKVVVIPDATGEIQHLLCQIGPGHQEVLAESLDIAENNGLLAIGHSMSATNGNQNNKISFWDLNGDEITGLTRRDAPALETLKDPVIDLALSPDGRSLATTSWTFDTERNPVNSSVRLWEMDSLTSEANSLKLPQQDGFVVSLDFNPSGDILATSSFSVDDGNFVSSLVQFWDPSSLQTGAEEQAQELASLVSDEAIISLAFSPVGDLMATTSVGRANQRLNIRFWDISQVASGGEPVLLATLPNVSEFGSDDILSSRIAFDNSGRFVATSGNNGAIRLWRIDQLPDAPIQIGDFGGHEDSITDLAFGPGIESLLLASSSEDGTIRLWRFEETEEGAELIGQVTVLRGHQGPIMAIAYNPDGTVLISRGLDETVRLWPLRSEDLLAEACRQSNRNLTHSELESFRWLGIDTSLICSNLPPHGSVIEASLFNVDTGEVQQDKLEETLALLQEAANASPSLGLNPELELAMALVRGGQEFASRGFVEGPLAALNKAQELDMLHGLGLNQTTGLGPNETVARLLLDASLDDYFSGNLTQAASTLERTVELALETSDYSLVSDICIRGANTTMVDLVIPACEFASELTAGFEEPLQALQLCNAGHEALLGESVMEACRTAVDLASTSFLAVEAAEVCLQLPLETDLELVGLACERATQLAVEKSDVQIALALCLEMRDPSLVDIVRPACELAVDDAISRQDLEVAGDLCQLSNIEGLELVASAACGQAISQVSAQGNSLLSYQLCLTRSNTPDEPLPDFCGELLGQAVQLSYGDLLSGTLAAGARDFWLFDGAEGDLVTIAMQAQSERLDPFLELVGPDGTLLIWDDDGGTDFNSRITRYELPVSGRYAIVASGFGDSEGDYLLTLRQGILAERQ